MFAEFPEPPDDAAMFSPQRTQSAVGWRARAAEVVRAETWDRGGR
jgi:hypothetical protein